MTISMQGSWTVRVKVKSAAYAQRFTIAGAATGNGTYAGDVATPAVAVTGARWTVTVEHNPGAGWRASDDQFKFPVVVSTAGVQQYAVDIESNDSGGDQDFNDLVLRCTTPVTKTEFLVYGHVSQYDESRCIFNPCSIRYFPVIDNLAALREALKIHEFRPWIERYYPTRAAQDPHHFRPLVLPLAEDAVLPAAKLVAPIIREPILRAPAFDKVAIARRIDALFRRCTSSPMVGFLLRFSEYDRTTAELTGGAYTGRGTREPLGTTGTDRNGNYVFRFSRTAADFSQEMTFDVATGEIAAQQAPPDVIAEVLDPGRPDGVAFESAPYWNIPTLKQINICVPKGSLGPTFRGCQGGRVLQAIGGISLLDPANHFDADGRITARGTATGTPQTDSAGWAGSLWLWGCFSDNQLNRPVTQYSVRYRHRLPNGSWDDWQFVQESYRSNKTNPPTAAQVGPWDRNVKVGGGAVVPAKVYDNIELDPQWQASWWYRKLILNSAIYAPNGGTVELRIEGYNAAGDMLVADSQILFVDNTPPDYAIDDVEVSGTPGNTCALFTVYTGTSPATSTAAAPFHVKFRANQQHGLLAIYGLGVSRGNAGAIPGGIQTVAPSALTGASWSVLRPNQDFHGTDDDPAAHDPASDDVTAVVQRTGGAAWLDGVNPLPGTTGVKFCTFIVSLSVSTRVTDGTYYPSLTYSARNYYFGLQELPGDAPPPPPR